MKRTALRALEYGLIAAGLSALAYSALAIAGAALGQRRAFAALARAGVSTAIIESHVLSALPDGPPAPQVPRRGAPFAVLEIPRLHVSEAVLEGSDGATLRRGPGRIEQTSETGGTGNIGIAGHRDTFFRPLNGIRAGDDILLSTMQGTFRYRVSSVEIVSPTDVSVLATTGVPTLTLVTCYPFWFVGPAPMRYVVRAIRTDTPQARNLRLS